MRNVHVVLISLSFAVTASCKSTSKKTAEPLETVDDSESTSEDSASSSGDSGGTGSASTRPSTAITPQGAKPAAASWAEMRQDCGGVSHVKYQDFYAISSGGWLYQSHLTFGVGVDPGRLSGGASGVAGDINPQHQNICKIFSSYFDTFGQKWEGDQKSNIQKGDRVNFNPELSFNYRQSIPLKSIADYRESDASPHTFIADKIETTIAYSAMEGSSGIVMFENVPVTVDCAGKLKYQIYTYQTQMPTNADEKKWCRTARTLDPEDNSECLAAEPSICSKKRKENGLCPEDSQATTLDSCSFLIPKLPIFDYSGKEIGRVKLGGYLFRLPYEASLRIAPFRYAVHRLEVLP